ncbi:glycine cleavage system H protein, mitochondrial precursor [Delitschia confertaspora ATCC 74209]|uniref:Glycine cleavage system H protein n=1 Tax=Delitschia confertaspora ATCC 74209 TaxID=1513339 RepID=A0A9P4JVF6_9PLEO|nr:glycine cleavage system H protein, mitochondrial precursor [Delitschia confertaspora ATCC 74209]
MAARLSIVRAARQFTSSVIHRPSLIVPASCQRWQGATPSRLFSGTSAVASDKKYTPDHEWFTTTNGTATLGISSYAAKALGDVVYIELPEVGLEISAGDAIGAVESVKSASDILTPVGGKVVEVNTKLEEKPSTVNQDPEGEGWIAKIEVQGEAEGETMSAEEYKKFTEEQ